MATRWQWRLNHGLQLLHLIRLQGGWAPSRGLSFWTETSQRPHSVQPVTQSRGSSVATREADLAHDCGGLREAGQAGPARPFLRTPAPRGRFHRMVSRGVTLQALAYSSLCPRAGPPRGRQKRSAEDTPALWSPAPRASRAAPASAPPSQLTLDQVAGALFCHRNDFVTPRNVF